MAKTQRRIATREVTNVVSSREVLLMTTGILKQAEIREKQDGSFAILYPDPGFAPCDCSKKCQQETMAGPKMIEAHYRASSVEAAYKEAAALGYNEPKLIPLETQSERSIRLAAERKAAKSQ